MLLSIVITIGLIMAILFGILVIFVLIVCILSMVYKIIDILNH